MKYILGLGAILLGLYQEAVKIFNLTPFDNLFIPKSKLKVYSVLRIVISSCILASIPVLISVYINVFFTKNTDLILIRVLANVSVLTFLLSLILLLVASAALRYCKGRINKLIRKSSLYIGMVHLFALQIFGGLFLSLIIAAQNIYEKYGSYVIIVFILILFNALTIKRIAALSKTRNRIHYVTKIEDRELYVIESHDPNRLILSTEREYSETAKMFIYDINEKNLTEFIPVVEKE